MENENNDFNVEVIKYKNLKDALKSIIKLQKLENQIDVVMYPSHILVPILKIIRRNFLVLDAGWSLFEGEVISRRKYGICFIRVFKFYLIDFIAAKFSNLIFLESKLQEEFYKKLFFVKKSKCKYLYTGVSESKFEIELEPKYPTFTVVFRGKYNNESGLEIIAKVSFLLNYLPIKFLIFSSNLPKNLAFSQNTEIYNYHVNQSELVKSMSKCHLMLGQMQDHPRLSRTIPHKAYESAFLSLPYLTARSKGILELFNESFEIICFSPGDYIALSNAIKLCFENREKLQIFGKRMNRKYLATISQERLSTLFIDSIKSTYFYKFKALPF